MSASINQLGFLVQHTATISVKLMNCNALVSVVIERHGWLHAFKIATAKPLPEQYHGDPLIVDAYTRGRDLFLEGNRRFGSRGSGDKAQGQEAHR